jgi:hypothetical protein
MRLAFFSVAIHSLRVALIGIASAALFFAIFVAAAIWAPQDQQAIRATIVDAIASGEINRQTTLGPLASFPVYRSVYDCLLFIMATAPERAGALAAAGNRTTSSQGSTDARVPPFPDCQTLLRTLPEFGGSSSPYFAYDRYVLGMRVVGRVMLSAMKLETMQRTLMGTAYALLGLIAVTALWCLRRARDPVERERALGYAGLAAALALFYGVHFFDATLNFGPMDCVHFIFILLSLIWPLAALPVAQLALYAASYGALIAIFEFLTGGIPLALALLPLLLALGHRGSKADYMMRVVTLCASFCVAVVATFTLKKIYAIAFLGDTENFIAALLHRTYGGLGENPDARYSLQLSALTYYRASFVIGWGSSKFAAVLFASSLAAIGLLTWRRRQASPNLRLACGLSLLALLLWYGVFLNHAILHAVYMVRLIVVVLILAAVLTLAAAALRAAPDSSHPGMESPPT